MVKILMIEDELLLVSMYKAALEAAGYEVISASGGEMGLEKIKELKPGLVLLDIMMPQMTGLDVLEAMKKDPQTSPIPVVMLTNLTRNPDPQIPISKGALDVWVKANNKPKDIVDKVNKLFERLDGKNTNN